jgi:hypothetical protein
MKKISLGIVLGALGLSNSLKANPQEDGASILINWSNNKGESKVFKIDDVEKDLGHEKIHSKTLLQKYVRTSKPYCSRSNSCKRRSSCSFGRKDRSCSFDKTYLKGKKKYSESVCKPCKPCKVPKVRKYRKPIVIEHRPVYKKHINYYPKKKQNKLHSNKYRDQSYSRSSSTEECTKKDYDNRVKKVSLDDLSKLLKLSKNNNSKANCEKRSASKLRKSNQVSKYLKDQDKKFLKKNAERSCSNEEKKSYKFAKANKNAKLANKDAEKSHEDECRDSHNIVNLNNKKNEALLMKEQDKDNLHSNDRIIEEFDKLEHFKKVEERCRNASKARNANVKKHQDMNKGQKANAASFNKEIRSNKKLRSNKNNASDNFFNKEKCEANRDSKYLKDEKECEAENDREREFDCKDEKDAFSTNSKNSANKHANKYDLINKKNRNNQDCKDVECNDDVDSYSRNKSQSRCSDKKKDNVDKCFNDIC